MQDFNRLDTENYEPPQKPGLIKTIPPFLYVILVLGIIFFLYQMIGGALALVSGSEGLDKNIEIIRIVLSFSQFMLILAPTIFFARLQTSDLKKTFRLNSPNPLILVLSVCGIFLVQPFLQGYVYFQDVLLDNLPFMKEAIHKARDLFDLVESATLKIVKAYSVPEFLAVVFVIGITPALCEELLFRGFVLSNFQKFAKPGAAIFLTGFLFAIYHFQPFNVVPLIILGFYLGFVVYYSNSIYTGIICHFLNNFFAAYLLFVYGKEEFETPRLSGSEKLNYAVMAAASLVLFIVLLILIYKLHKKTGHHIIPSSERKKEDDF